MRFCDCGRAVVPFLGRKRGAVALYGFIRAGFLIVFPVLVAYVFMRLYAESHGTPLFRHACTWRDGNTQPASEPPFVGAFGWGTAGSGLATGIAFTSGFAVMVSSLLKKGSLVCLRKGSFSFRLLKKMTYNGSSEGLSELSAGITEFPFNWVLMKNWGEVGVAAFTAINYMQNLGIFCQKRNRISQG